MTPAEGIAALKRRHGSRALWRVGTEPSSPEQRQANRDRLASLRADKAAIDKEIADRLAALDWYQALRARRTETIRQIQACDFAEYYRISIGHQEMGFFHVDATGDNWADAIRNLNRKDTKP